MKYVIRTRTLGSQQVMEVKCTDAPDEFADVTGGLFSSFGTAMQSALSRASYASLLTGEPVEIVDEATGVVVDVEVRRRVAA